MQQEGSTSVPSEQQAGLLFACLVEGAGRVRQVDWDMVRQWNSGSGALWVHLDRKAQTARDWLMNDSGLTAPTVAALLEKESRPRVFRGKRGYIAILRGVNLNEGAEQEDMVALRIWCDGERVITIRDRRLFVPRALFDEMLVGDAIVGCAAELFCQLIEGLVRQTADVLTDYTEQLDELELLLETEQTKKLSRQLADLRNEVVMLRRYIAPQREALGHLTAEPPAWLPDELKPSLRDASDRQQRYLEELDALRERSIVIKDDLSNRLNEVMNKNMYIISVIAAIFLPLSFLTGLLGINVGGMPGVDSSVAFWITCAIMVGLLVIELWLFRKLKWF